MPVLRERYLAERNPSIITLLTNPQRTETERFRDAFEKIQQEAKIIQVCLDGHSRSSMWRYLNLMINYGMFTRADAAQFSPGLQQQLEPMFAETEQ